MGDPKRKAVISADAEDLSAVEALVREGRYRTVSEFVREAMAEYLDRVRRERLAEQVGRYCEEVSADEDAELVAWQAFDPPPASRGRRRAKG
jgi:Arc/MetJ-type ribon-helix-helix transcriptional regulator